MASKSCCKEKSVKIDKERNTVLHDTQEKRDIELSTIKDIPLDIIKSIDITDTSNITIWVPSAGIPLKAEEFEKLYTNYSNLDLIAYIKVLMFTSVKRRGVNLMSNLDKANGRCLDYGSGVGTHALHLMQRGNKVWIYDVPSSPLLDFTLQRINYHKAFGNFVAMYMSKLSMPDDWFDFVNCLDVLEHCPNPLDEIKTIHRILKKNALLHLQVSEMIKPSSGHFDSSIDIWKTQGKDFLKSYFIEESKNMYRKVKA